MKNFDPPPPPKKNPRSSPHKSNFLNCLQRNVNY